MPRGTRRAVRVQAIVEEDVDRVELAQQRLQELTGGADPERPSMSQRCVDIFERLQDVGGCRAVRHARLHHGRGAEKPDQGVDRGILGHHLPADAVWVNGQPRRERGEACGVVVQIRVHPVDGRRFAPWNSREEGDEGPLRDASIVVFERGDLLAGMPEELEQMTQPHHARDARQLFEHDSSLATGPATPADSRSAIGAGGGQDLAAAAQARKLA